jgi:predicted  nucleic acid-binding Zn-ribbon protein
MTKAQLNAEQRKLIAKRKTIARVLERHAKAWQKVRLKLTKLTREKLELEEQKAELDRDISALSSEVGEIDSKVQSVMRERFSRK